MLPFEDWLENFDPLDRELAASLLARLEYVSEEQVILDLRNELDLLLQRDAHATVLLPVLGKGDIEKLILAVGKTVPAGRTPAIFTDYDPRLLSAVAGSEATISRLLREYSARGALGPAHDLNTYRSSRVRRIVLVTDLVSSGTQVRSFIKTVLANRTVLSWYSHHWFEVHVVCYAISERARNSIHRAFPRVVLHSVRAEATFDNSPWTGVQRSVCEDLCTQYQKDHSVPALGYRNQGSLLALGFKVSNTLPPVFWQSRSGWNPLFPGRLVPQQIVQDRAPFKAPVDHKKLLQWNNQARASLGVREYSRIRSRDLIYLLSLARSSRLHSEKVEVALGVSASAASDMIEYATACSWLDDEWRLTDAGRREFNAAKRPTRTSGGPTVASVEESYYPSSLR